MHHSPASPRKLLQAAALCAMAGAAWCANAGAIAPPPLPPGSEHVKVQSGQSPDETARMLRAHKHHHKLHDKKDYTHDYSMDDDDAHDGKSTANPAPGRDQAKNVKPNSR